MSTPATATSSSNLIQFDKKKQFLNGAAAVGIQVSADADPDVLAAILADNAFPDRQIELGRISVQADAKHDILFDAGRGQVKFSGSASAFAGLGVYKDPAALLKALNPPDEVAPALNLGPAGGPTYLLLRWGYNLQGSAQGSIALGAFGQATFGVDGRTEGLFATVRCFPKSTGAQTELTDLVQSWMLPSSVSTIAQLQPGTWLFSELDGTIGLKIGAQFGHDFNWVRSLPLGGITGDIGLRIQMGAAVALGFNAQGRYGIVVARESLDAADQQLRLRIFKLAKKGWDFAFNAGVSVTPSVTGLPKDYKEFIGAIFGLHSAQFLKDLQLFSKWTNPANSLPDLFADVAVNEGFDLLKQVTGIDPRKAFDQAKGFLTDLLKQWDQLPHRLTTTIWNLIPVEGAFLRIADLARQVGTANQATLQALLEKQLSNVSFFETPEGKWLEAAVGGAVLTPLTSSQTFADLQNAAKLTASILDGSALQEALTKLKSFIDAKLGIDQIRKVVDQASFDKLNGFLKAKLSAFLGAKIDFTGINKVREAIHKLDTMGQSFYDKAIQALNQKYSFAFSAAYQSSDTKTALLDVTFDFSAKNADLPALLQKAIDGDYRELLLTPADGVTLNLGTLTHQVQRQSHVEITLPHFKMDIDHFNQALAQFNAVQQDGARLLVYDLDAKDTASVSNRRQSSLTIGAHLAIPTNRVVQHAKESLSYSYSYTQAVRNMRRAQLQDQLKPYVAAYLPRLFPGSTTGAASGSFEAWVGDLDKLIDQVDPNGTDNFGNTLLSLELSLPEEVVASWLNAPTDDKSAPAFQEYMDMSRGLQRKLKDLIPFYFFSDPKNYTNLASAQVLLAWSAIPPCTTASLTDGKLTLNTNKDVFWNFPDPDLRHAMLHNPITAGNLSRLLQAAANRLQATPGLESEAAFYDPNQVGNILNAAENSPAADLLGSLLLVEATLTARAKKAGIEIAKFRTEVNRDPTEAITQLEKFGSDITALFNAKLSGTYGGDATRPLSTMLFLEAASAFNQVQAKPAPVAKLDVTVLRQSAAFPPASFPNNAPPDPKDVVCRQVLLNLGA